MAIFLENHMQCNEEKNLYVFPRKKLDKKIK